jgi:hypothetical protein
MTLNVPDDCDAVVYALLDLRGEALSTFILTDTGWAVFTKERLEAKLAKPVAAPKLEPTEFDDDFLS